MLAVLLGLGTWQVRRLAWKDALVAEIARGEAAAAIPLPADPPAFTKVRAEGRLDGSRFALYGTAVQDLPGGAQLGADLIVPLDRPGEDPVLVDLGWVPLNRPAPPSGPAAVDGYVRRPEPGGWLTPRSDPTARHAYALDPAAIGAMLGLPRVAPYTLVALGTVPFGATPVPAAHLPQPPNNHLSYAITWYGLAAALVAVYVVWARKVLSP